MGMNGEVADPSPQTTNRYICDELDLSVKTRYTICCFTLRLRLSSVDTHTHSRPGVSPSLKASFPNPLCWFRPLFEGSLALLSALPWSNSCCSLTIAQRSGCSVDSTTCSPLFVRSNAAACSAPPLSLTVSPPLPYFGDPAFPSLPFSPSPSLRQPINTRLSPTQHCHFLSLHL